jgi:hypothetical protein
MRKLKVARLTLKAGPKSKINNKLYDIGTHSPETYYTKIPLGDVDQVLKSNGVVMLQEDNTEWDGFLLGREGQARMPVAPLETKDDQGMYTPFDNTILHMTWFKVDNGKYEFLVRLT